MILKHTCDLRENNQPLELQHIPIPVPNENELLVKVSACGVCHTDLDEIEGRTPPAHFPVVLGHQVVGRVEETGSHVRSFQIGDRVGIAWIYSACGKCPYCLQGQENLCQQFQATGRDANGGYAQYVKVSENFAYPIPQVFSDAEAAPLLCAGAIGYRSLKLANLQDGQTLGLAGFGASAHLVLQLAKNQYPNARIYVFARGSREREFARQLGAVWAGAIEDESPEKLNSIIDTTPVWKPVVEALKNLAPGGRLVINAIRKENADRAYLENLDYPTHLWLEKEIKSVANITRQDIIEWLQLAATIPIKPEIQQYPLEQANLALMELKTGQIRGAKVLKLQ